MGKVVNSRQTSVNDQGDAEYELQFDGDVHASYYYKQGLRVLEWVILNDKSTYEALFTG
jgi:hypothetical protein